MQFNQILYDQAFCGKNLIKNVQFVVYVQHEWCSTDIDQNETGRRLMQI